MLLSLAHKLKIFRDRQEPAADHLEHVPRIVGGRQLLPLEFAAFAVAADMQGPNKIVVFAACDVVVLLVVPEFAAAKEVCPSSTA